MAINGVFKTLVIFFIRVTFFFRYIVFWIFLFERNNVDLNRKQTCHDLLVSSNRNLCFLVIGYITYILDDTNSDLVTKFTF